MLRLYLVRHGETDWNVDNRLQGSLNSELTSKGIRDVARLKNDTDQIDWEAIYSSPSKRAFQTAKILRPSEHISCDDRLKEMNIGKFEGLTWDEVKLTNEHQYKNYWENPQNFFIPSAETFMDVEKRVDAFIMEVKNIHADGNIMVVSHGVIIKVAENIIQNKHINDLWDTPHINGATMIKLQIN